MGGFCVKVECIAIVKDYAKADVRAQQTLEDAFTRMGIQAEAFHVLEDANLFFRKMGEMFARSDVIVAAADEGSFLEQKWNMLKALGLKSEICPAVASVIRAELSAPDTSMKAHALMPKDAAVFLTSDGLYSGFAVQSGKQTLLYLPLSGSRMDEIVENGVEPYFADRIAAAAPKAETRVEETPEPPDEKPQAERPTIDIPDNNERFDETARLLSERDLTVAFASTETNVFIQNGVRSNPLFGESFIPAAVQDDPASRDSRTERIACLADAARQEIGTTLGAAISNIYSLGMDSKELFLYVALSDGTDANVRKITGQPGLSTGDLVSLATNELYTMLQDYADGAAFPPDDTEVKPLRLYAESAQSAAANAKRKRGTAIRVAVCIAIALILCVLIGFYFKDQVSAFFDNVQQQAPAALVQATTTTTMPQTTEYIPEETTEQTQPFTAEDVDLALFGTADAVPEETTTAAATLSAEEWAKRLAKSTTAAGSTATTAATTKKAATTAATTKKTAATTAASKTTTRAAFTLPEFLTTTRAAKSAQEATEKEKETTTKAASTTAAAAKASDTTTTAKAETTTAATTVATTTTKPATTAAASTDVSGTKFTFTAYGYGHGVGMSQLGALAYSQKGWSYRDILSHYYPGTTLTRETPPSTVTYHGQTYEMENFMIRVVQQEIGGYCRSGDEEALKAQTVAAYSYIKARNFKLGENSVARSTLPESQLSSMVRAAVKSVLGEYLTYNGKTISAQFFASSAGKTTSAESVWGGNYPYLQGGVESIESVSASSTSVSTAEFKKMVEAYNRNNPSKSITLSGAPSGWLEILSHDRARGDVGYVREIRVGDRTMSGNDFRVFYNTYSSDATPGLRSHCFSIALG